MFVKEVITEGKCHIFGFSFIFERKVGMDVIRVYKTKRSQSLFQMREETNCKSLNYFNPRS